MKTFKPTDFSAKNYLKNSKCFKKGCIYVRFSKENEIISIPEQDKSTKIDYKINNAGMPIIYINKNQEYPYMQGQPKEKILDTFNKKYENTNDVKNGYFKFKPKQNDYRLVSNMFDLTLNKNDIFVPWGNSDNIWIKQKSTFDSYIAVSLTKDIKDSIHSIQIKIDNEQFYLKKSWTQYHDKDVPDIYSIAKSDKWQYESLSITV